MTRWPPRPTLARSFYKGHGLGNDYLVFEEGDDWVATPSSVRRVCDRHRGIGADGIVALLRGGEREEGGRRLPKVAAVPLATGDGIPAEDLAVRLRMFNPDGGEFERSGNGLRILASYLLRADPSKGEIDVEVGGSRVSMVGHGREGATYDVSVEMGRARTGPEAIEMDPEALDRHGRLRGPDGASLEVVCVSVGNPHVVVMCRDEAELTEERLADVGPFVAEHPAIAQGANVQLALHNKGRECSALVWERGVGRTAASGTSACAVAVAFVSSGRLEPGDVTVRMPGGALSATVSRELDVRLRGPVEEIAEGRLSARLLAARLSSE